MDNIIAHACAERNNSTERVNLMLKEEQGIIVKITRTAKLEA